jgi:hypothetical protein
MRTAPRLLVVAVVMSAMAACAAPARRPVAMPEAPMPPPPTIPPASVVVHVTGPDGAPEAGMKVGVVPLTPENKVHGPSTTGADGTVRFGRLTPGLYRVGLLGGGGLAEGWMLHDDAWATSTVFEVGVAELIGRRVDLFAPAAGTLEATADVEGSIDPGAVRLDVLRRYPDGSWRPSQNETSWSGRREGPRIAWRLDGVPDGSYRVVLRAKGRSSSHQDVDLRAGARTTPVHLVPGPPAPAVQLVFEGDAPAAEGGEQTFALVELGDAPFGDVAHGTFGGEPRAAVVDSVRPGRYLLVLWRSRLAVRVDVPAQGDAIRLTPPKGVSGGGGSRVIHAEVLAGATAMPGLVFALAPASDDPLAVGRWFRIVDSVPGSFPDVPAGDHDLVVLDGLHGAQLGIRPNPTIRRIHVADDDVALTLRR